MSYADLDTMKQRLGETGGSTDNLIQAALDWGTQWIDDYCHRTFEQYDQTREFDHSALNAENKRTLDLDEDLLSVETLTNGDGVEITDDQYILEPRNERPYYQIRLLSTAWWVFPVDGLVSVEGKWGYSVSADNLIFGTCLTLAEFHYRSRRLADVVTLTSATTGQPATPRIYAFPDSVYVDLAPRVKVGPMSVNTVLDALQTFNLAIPGIGSAPTIAPNTLDGFVFPCVTAFPGLSRWRGSGGLGAQWRASRIYHVTFYLSPTNPTQVNNVDLFNTYLGYIDTIGDAYRALTSLGSPPVAIAKHRDNSTEAISDTGPLVMSYLSDADQYYGFIIDLPLIELE